MEGTACPLGGYICLPCSISSRKLLAYDPPLQPPGEAGSWAFGIISYFINGLNSHSWGQLEGLLDLIMLDREAARNISHGTGQRQPGRRSIWWDVSHATQDEGVQNHGTPQGSKTYVPKPDRIQRKFWSQSIPRKALKKLVWVYTTLTSTN